MHSGDEIIRLTHRLTDKARTPYDKVQALVEEGLFGSGDGAKQLQDLIALKPEIERMLRHHSRT